MSFGARRSGNDVSNTTTVETLHSSNILVHLSWCNDLLKTNHRRTFLKVVQNYFISEHYISSMKTIRISIARAFSFLNACGHYLYFLQKSLGCQNDLIVFTQLEKCVQMDDYCYVYQDSWWISYHIQTVSSAKPLAETMLHSRALTDL